ncbi:M23 family metallopeptidase [Iningainema tapete]|uniref:M23 family metallopeptidase n=1 Tax=Iningainema tapete BLCC-T55 TaxID=2748662 RepID=A0A8J6XS12_9CYAN|nr:M23 family metallopeptidase [Iningainema tapete]MBD2776451.1 M23 family metallopeptidase [Iningainema tapete BLCC-T55]
MSKRPQRKARSFVTLLLLGLTIVVLITQLPKAETVKAVEFNRKLIATSGGWQAASFPVENFQAYTSPFGYRRSASGGNNMEFHGGLDIAAPQGSYIRNWWAGTVVKLGDRDACGTHIVIQSGNWEHTYCHMEGSVENSSGRRYMSDRAGGIVIWEGQQIPAGARIGRVGMTGRTTGPHLHWGLKYGKNYVDPAKVLREMFSQQQIAGGSTNPQQSAVTIEESKYIRDNGY